MYLYDVELVGNPEFEEITKDGWEDSWQNDNGELPAPEWSDDVKAIWGEGARQFYMPEDWYNALNVLFYWRAEQGMQPLVEKVPLVIEESEYEMCSPDTAAQVAEYAQIIETLTSSNVIEMYYPGLDDAVEWLDERYGAESQRRPAPEEENDEGEEWTEMDEGDNLQDDDDDDEENRDDDDGDDDE